jgi:hypothetical protein
MMQSRRRTKALVGIACLAVLGGGAFLITDEVSGDHATTVTTGSGTLEPSATSTTAPKIADPSDGAPLPSTTSAPAREKSLGERLATARSANARAGTEVRRPLPPQNGTAMVAADELTVTKSGSLVKDGATLQVVSARHDLTGQRELSWAADDGRAVDKVRCTQNFRFSAGTPAVEKPMLLLCWRVSAARSVYTIAVTVKGRPSTAVSAAAINRRWAKLG